MVLLMCGIVLTFEHIPKSKTFCNSGKACSVKQGENKHRLITEMKVKHVILRMCKQMCNTYLKLQE
jgi:hypothetical protein